MTLVTDTTAFDLLIYLSFVNDVCCTILIASLMMLISFNRSKLPPLLFECNFVI